MKPEHLISFLVIILILIILWPRSSKKSKSKSNKTVKENFIDETMREDNGTFSLFNWNGNSEESEDNIVEEDTIEHFPQSTPMNVIYTDTNGNLSNTSDLGLQNLTVTGNGALQLGSKFRLNANKDFWADDEWLRLSNPANTDYGGGFAAGKLWSNGNLSTDTLNVRSSGSVAGGLNVGGQVNTMGKTNYPKGWGGGVRTFDLYGNGTLGWGDDNANLSTTIGGGNIWSNGNVSAGGTVSAQRILGGDYDMGNTGLSIHKASNEWTGRVHNPTSGASVYMSHGGKYGMHINANNKDMGTYILECYAGDKRVMNVYGNGNVNISDSITVNGRDILAELNDLNSRPITVNVESFEVNGSTTINCQYTKFPKDGKIIQRGITLQSGDRNSWCTYPIPFTSITKRTFGGCNRTSGGQDDNNGFCFDSNFGSHGKCDIAWEVVGYYK